MPWHSALYSKFCFYDWILWLSPGFWVQRRVMKQWVLCAWFQEPGPAKVAVTGSGIPEAEKTPDSSSIIWQEELQSREADVSQTWSASEMPPLGSSLPSAGAADIQAVDLKRSFGAINCWKKNALKWWSHLYLYSAFNNTNCNKATAQSQNRKIVCQ